MRVETKLDDVCSRLDKFEEKMDRFIETAENRYASKWVEKSVIAMFGTLIVSMLGMFVFLIQSHIK